METPMKKPESVTIRVTAEVKALIVKQAKEEHRSITSYLEWLVLKDARRREPR